jgi:hypothetical protein
VELQVTNTKIANLDNVILLQAWQKCSIVFEAATEIKNSNAKIATISTQTSLTIEDTTVTNCKNEDLNQDHRPLFDVTQSELHIATSSFIDYKDSLFVLSGTENTQTQTIVDSTFKAHVSSTVKTL